MIDVETTSLDPERERIVEIAIVRADEHGRPIDHWATRLNPGIPMRATHVHGITNADVAGPRGNRPRQEGAISRCAGCAGRTA